MRERGRTAPNIACCGLTTQFLRNCRSALRARPPHTLKARSGGAAARRGPQAPEGGEAASRRRGWGERHAPRRLGRSRPGTGRDFPAQRGHFDWTSPLGGHHTRPARASARRFGQRHTEPCGRQPAVDKLGLASKPQGGSPARPCPQQAAHRRNERVLREKGRNKIGSKPSIHAGSEAIFGVQSWDHF